MKNLLEKQTMFLLVLERKYFLAVFTDNKEKNISIKNRYYGEYTFLLVMEKLFKSNNDNWIGFYWGENFVINFSQNKN